MMPGKSGPPARSLRIRLSRTSSCTGRRTISRRSTAWRSAPTVEIEVLDISRSYQCATHIAQSQCPDARRPRDSACRELSPNPDLGLAFSSVDHRALCIVPFFRPGPPRVFAHRGGAALGPENTIAAFDHGLTCGADGLELDVRLSADGIVVVCHDETLDRTTDTTGPVAARTASELAQVDAG